MLKGFLTFGKSNKQKKMNKLDAFKSYLAESMAEIDALNFPHKTLVQHYNENMELRDFDLLKYWLDYNGVFDGGRDMLDKLRILLD